MASGTKADIKLQSLQSQRIRFVEKEEKNDAYAYIGAAGAAIFLGLADYLASLLATLGLKGIWAEWFGCIVCWGLYHTYAYVSWKREADADAYYFTKATSMYYEEVVPEKTETAETVPSAVKLVEPNSASKLDSETSENK